MAGAIDETFSARFVASIAAFNVSALGRWDSVFMVETRGGDERNVQREGSEEDSQKGECPFITRCLAQTGPENCIQCHGLSAEKRRV